MRIFVQNHHADQCTVAHTQDPNSSRIRTQTTNFAKVLLRPPFEVLEKHKELHEIATQRVDINNQLSSSPLVPQRFCLFRA